MKIRTRMAPSPTGEYHIGNMRSLLYNYALARKTGGQFIIRVEDTDQERLVEGAVDRMLKVIKDYGFSWDEGPQVEGPHSPYIQSQRLEIYKKYAQELVEKGKAYYCFCTKERLEELREKQQEEKLPTTKYDKKCLSLSQEEINKNLEEKVPYVIRLNVPSGENITFKDEILGELSFPSNDIDDQVLLKSDGFPTYHLAVVVDDHLMEITHVLRGREWLSSTPKHILLYKYFGWDLPKYAHLPLLRESDSNKKLSKRSGSVDAVEFLKDGYLPEAINNFLMFLGWNPGTEKEMYSLEEFIKDFSLEKVHTSEMAAFDRTKLLWINGVYIRNMSSEDLLERIKKWSKEFEMPVTYSSDDYDLGVVSLVQERLKKLSEYSELTDYFYNDPNVDLGLATKYSGSREKTKEILKKYLDLYQNISEDDWKKEDLDRQSHELLEKENYKPKEAFMTLRVAVTGKDFSPPLFEVMQLLGKVNVVNRIEKLLL